MSPGFKGILALDLKPEDAFCVGIGKLSQLSIVEKKASFRTVSVVLLLCSGWSKRNLWKESRGQVSMMMTF